MADEVHRADDIGKGDGGKPSPQAIAAMVVGGLLLLFAVLNLEDTSIDFGIASVSMPLVLVIGVCAGLGFGAGLLVAHHRQNRHD